MSDVFYCYSPTLRKELMENAHQRYIARSVNPSTNREFWMFLYTDELIDYLNKRPLRNSLASEQIQNHFPSLHLH